MEPSRLKQTIKRRSAILGMDIIGVADCRRWEEYGDTDASFYPQSIWPWSKTVIVMGVQIFLPMLATTPSIVYSELYNTTNRLLDEASYRIAGFLNNLGFRALFFPRDGYGDISILVKNPAAAFSQVLAGKYAGLGTIGYNHTLLTKEYGPRVRLVSIITDAKLPPNDVIKEDLCLNCGQCKVKCPMRAFSDDPDSLCAKMDKHKCAEYHQRLKNEYCYPCGVCTLVCPVGLDRKRYSGVSTTASGVDHCRAFGSAIT